MHKHAIRMEKELSRATHIDGVFKQTNIRKVNGEFVDERSRKTHEEFQRRYSQVRSEVASCAAETESSPLDPIEDERIRTKSWVLAVAGNKKGRIYGVGELAHNFGPGDTLSYSGSTDSCEIMQLKEQVLSYRGG